MEQGQMGKEEGFICLLWYLNHMQRMVHTYYHIMEEIGKMKPIY